VFIRLIHPLLFITIASGIVIFDVFFGKLSWLRAAIAVFFLTKGGRGLMVYLQIRSTSPSEDVFTAKYFRLLAVGYFLTAALSFVSWLRGEGLLSLFLSLSTTISTIVWMFVTNRSEPASK